MHPVIAAIGRGAAAYPHRPALADNERMVSYRALSGAIGEKVDMWEGATTA